jgi:hypothetical protein
MPTVSSKFLPETLIFISFVNLDWAIVIDAPLGPVDVTAACADAGKYSESTIARTTGLSMDIG